MTGVQTCALPISEAFIHTLGNHKQAPRKTGAQFCRKGNASFVIEGVPKLTGYQIHAATSLFLPLYPTSSLYLTLVAHNVNERAF